MTFIRLFAMYRKHGLGVIRSVRRAIETIGRTTL